MTDFNKGNAMFSRGTMWLPVKGETGSVIDPLYSKGSMGNLMPYINVRILDEDDNKTTKENALYESIILPYENIVSFEYTEIGEGLGTASLTFVDSTPVFIEALIRSLYGNNVKDKRLPIDISWGYRFGNLDGVKDDFLSQLGEGNNLTYGPVRFMVNHATYEYTSFGVISTLTLHGYNNTKLDGYKVSKNFKLDRTKLTSKTGLAKELTRLVNSTLRGVDAQDIEYKVNISDDDIDISKLVGATSELSFTGEQTVNQALNMIKDRMTIRSSAKAKDTEGQVYMYVSNSFSSDNNNKRLYEISFFSRDGAYRKAQFYPQINYPAYESPILSWQPEIVSNAEYIFLTNQNYRRIDKDGNEIETEVGVRPEPAEGLPNQTSGSKQTVVGGSNNTESVKRAQPVMANIGFSIIGDPLISSKDLYWSSFDVINNDIVAQGLLRDNDSFFSKKNFPQVNSSKLPLGYSEIKGIPTSQSPFTGRYFLSGLKHRIDAQSGFTQEIKLMRIG